MRKRAHVLFGQGYSTLCTNEIPVTHLAWMCLRCQSKSLKLLRHRK